MEIRIKLLILVVDSSDLNHASSEPIISRDEEGFDPSQKKIRA